MRNTLAGLLAISIAALTAACGSGASASIQQATIEIDYSRFGPNEITLVAGEPVVITLENNDPIAHEWIVGDEAVHERHRTGTEPYHDQIPTEVTVPSFSTRKTMLTFDQPGRYEFICHLPGHEAYGMTGTVLVVEG